MSSQKIAISLLFIVTLALCGDPQTFGVSFGGSRSVSTDASIDGSYVVDKVSETAFTQ